ncbi:MAG: 4-hydroxythreonine-4-phosphate dehydrogenase PdxA [Kiritimatiellae bacterium]|jgi:4-hydroxythreonine-4-phosphate dehydrogenase|nr:4-hydroxythreonine-4-phosphate dehydrogenase PdxA [Kiritimatiellia bacterium]NLD89591.1 4-hydroxythreonine-4-phosphate dehydrogenase PdxA [Lentisphaerota bacterium]HPC19808.1 4-hydroxythreonine-4-phosphate dehydrogenase PdxA [Kiritimatiellia bacterium]HQQ61099.1 4-hydroxythreonine-4-phosphate dehydrogenase PdxA [Kiritimatiellia bacterium]
MTRQTARSSTRGRPTAHPLCIGITAGDPNGIGPEVALKAALGPQPANRRLVLVGHRAVWLRAATLLGRRPPPEIHELAAPIPRLCTWDPGPAPAPRPRPGRVCADAARAAYAYILAATAAAQTGHLQAIVTAPISKEAFQLAGICEPGHTELLARLTGARRYAMMLFGDKIRVVLATRHLPLRKVADALTADAIVDAVELLACALPWMGFRRARIGVCGLNPHAGDGGALGTEEQTILAPALARCRRRGWNVAGPVPADVIFHQHLAGQFDAVVAMYHDQGLAPLKMLSFETGVNLTLGLPIVRTSPDHGTAFDLAGQGVAHSTSLRAALDWAARLATRRNPWA